MAYKGPHDLVTPSLTRYNPCARQKVLGNPEEDVIHAIAIGEMFKDEKDIIEKEGVLRLTRGVMGKFYGIHEEEWRWVYLGICKITVVLGISFSWKTEGWGDFLTITISRSTVLR